VEQRRRALLLVITELGVQHAMAGFHVAERSATVTVPLLLTVPQTPQATRASCLMLDLHDLDPETPWLEGTVASCR
jgi:hypothetical protein